MANFVGRERELRALARACGGGGLAVVSGRRRVGKTALLDRFARDWDGPAVFLPGTRAPTAEALRRLEERVRAVLTPEPGDALDLGGLESWDAALGYLLARARREPVLLVLDEFPYLCEADPSLPSTLQARWDHRGEAALSVVLAGSHVGLMEDLLAADAPLFGRADAHLRVAPFGWREAPDLVGGDDPDTWLEAVVTVGGMPRYLSLWDPRHDALTNLVDLLDGPGAPLGDEGLVVQQELNPASAPARLLELIALGAATFGELRERSGLAPATTSGALDQLERLGLLERQTPAGEDRWRTRRVRYEVRDPLLGVWLALVQPHREAFELGRGGDVLASGREALAAAQRAALARVARDWLATTHGAEVGPWWAGGTEEVVDALALRGGAPVAAATAHWAQGVEASGPAGRVRAALASTRHGPPQQVQVVARGGTGGVTTPDDLYADARGW